MSTKDPETLKKLFLKKKVLELLDVFEALDTTSRMTAYRHLSKLDYLSSYSHNGKFYTLREIAKFDDEGIWHYGDVGFSTHETLIETIAHVIQQSEAGKIVSELEKQYRVRVQNTLMHLVQAKEIDREKLMGKLFLYTSMEENKKAEQLKKRRKKVCRTLSKWIIMEILVEIIHASAEIVTPEIVAERLSQRGSSISLREVQQVFQDYDLEKKNRD